MTDSYDIAVCGGGLVGLGTAWALVRDHAAKVLVLEAEDAVGAHQSSHNSGVIHSGLYYAPGSHKARLCVAGREEMFAFCAEHEVPHRRSGKMVLATHPDEIPRLELLQQRGGTNGLEGLERLDAKGIEEKEPHARGIAALWVPETGIADFGGVARTLATLIERRGGEVRRATRVTRARAEGASVAIETTTGPVAASFLVACAGLAADRVARMCGVKPGLATVPFRGEYYELIPSRRHLVRAPIYPVPNPALPFLGVHLTPTTGGSVEAGPNAVLAWHRHGYRRGSISLKDTAAMLGYGGFWRMAFRHLGIAADEAWRSWNKRAFVKTLQRLVPELSAADVVRGGSGVRAMALDPDGSMVDDFRFVPGPRMLHVLNAPSPAATASLAIGRHIASEVAAAL